jgi:hypothetical protein
MFPKSVSVTCLMLLCGMVLSCEQPAAPQTAVSEPVEAPAEDAPEAVDEPADVPAEEPDEPVAPVEEPPEVEPEPEPAEEEPEPSPWLAGWIYLVDVEDVVHYSAEEPGAQLRAAYYDMRDKWNRQEREGHPFRVEEG